MDNVALHPYPNVNTDAPEKGYCVAERRRAEPRPRAAGVLGRVQRHGAADVQGDRRGWLTAGFVESVKWILDEAGWQTNTQNVVGYNGQENVPAVDEATQARYHASVVRRFECDPRVAALLFFHWVDETDRDRFQSGAIRADDTEKPVVDAVKDAIDSGCTGAARRLAALDHGRRRDAQRHAQGRLPLLRQGERGRDVHGDRAEEALEGEAAPRRRQGQGVPRHRGQVPRHQPRERRFVQVHGQSCGGPQSCAHGDVEAVEGTVAAARYGVAAATTTNARGEAVAVISDTHLPRGARRLPARCARALQPAPTCCSTAATSANSACGGCSRSSARRCAGVHGNMDEPELRDLLPADRDRRGRGRADRDGAHPRPGGRARARGLRASFPDCDAIVYGTRTCPRRPQDEGVWILNPGSPTERRTSPTHAMLVLEVEAGRDPAEPRQALKGVRRLRYVPRCTSS